MRYYDELDMIEQKLPTVVTLGKFDGLHRGHQKLLNAVREEAKAKGYQIVLFTFEVAPQIEMGMAKYRSIVTNAEKKSLVKRNGIDVMVVCKFTEEIRNMEPERFVNEILIKKLNAKTVVVGEDFRFGRNRKGTPQYLQDNAQKFGLNVQVIEKEKYKDREISSSFIREELLTGKIEKVNKLLGYRYFITGIVTSDTHIGTSIGVPTLNIIPEPEKILPPRGVYSSAVLIDDKEYPSITNIGIKPTVSGEKMGVETHILDFNEDIYGKEVIVMLEHFQRAEQKFASLELLKEQLLKDIEIRRGRI